MLSEQFGRLSWEDISERHPDYDEGIDWAANQLAHATAEDPDAEGASFPVDYAERMVPVGRIKKPHPASYDRRMSAAQGYREGAEVPPVVLVHRAGRYEIADGHHRVAAARSLGMDRIPAYVAKSPHRTAYPKQAE
jgi:hypothetical protein